MTREAVTAALAGWLCRLPVDRPQRVAVNGIDAAGKTTLAGELARALEARGRPALRASLDDFQRPRAERYRQGPLSPDGYYDDAFDLPALRACLLEPAASGEPVRTAVFDYRADLPFDLPPVGVSPGAVLLVDGVFLLRPELCDLWDAAIAVRVSFETALARARVRDASAMGGPAAVEARYRARYLPAQRRYLAECRPYERAAAVVDNDYPLNPSLTWNRLEPL